MERSAASFGFGRWAVPAAVLVTFFFPFLALIGALLWLRRESDPQRRAFLRRWAWASAAWLLIPIVLAVVLSSVN